MGIIADRLQGICTKLQPPTLTEPLQEISGGHISQALLNKQIMNAGMSRKNLDSKYWVCSRIDFDAIIKWDWTNDKKYVAEKYDCDNFAFSFKARMDRKFHLNNVGLVIDYSGGHAYNCVVFSDGTAELFEPQSDRFVTDRIGTGQYKSQEGIIVF